MRMSYSSRFLLAKFGQSIAPMKRSLTAKLMRRIAASADLRVANRGEVVDTGLPRP
jgi:hypothetical protein